MSYIMTKTNLEIDLVLQAPNKETIFIEIKSKNSVKAEDCKSLVALADPKSKIKAYLFSTDPVAKKINNVYCLHWEQGLKELGLS